MGRWVCADLANFKGKGVMMDFYSRLCVKCNEHFPTRSISQTLCRHCDKKALEETNRKLKKLIRNAQLEKHGACGKEPHESCTKCNARYELKSIGVELLKESK